jgi:hypothetical protein
MYWQVVRGPVTGFRHGVSFERLGRPIKCVSLNRGSGLQFCKKCASQWRMLRAADAIRFAIQELPPELLLTAQLKVAEERFDGDGVRRLYASVEYPLARRAPDWRRMRQVNDLSGLGRHQ